MLRPAITKSGQRLPPTGSAAPHHEWRVLTALFTTKSNPARHGETRTPGSPGRAFTIAEFATLCAEPCQTDMVPATPPLNRRPIAPEKPPKRHTLQSQAASGSPSSSRTGSGVAQCAKQACDYKPQDLSGDGHCPLGWTGRICTPTGGDMPRT